ncbi:hypothetical protein ACHAWF_006933, partial [Thalassiosira exigua]
TGGVGVSRAGNDNDNDGEGAGARGGGPLDLDVFLSHDGTGCPPEEAECLLRCLDAREGREATRRELGPYDGRADPARLSADYRAALCECLLRLRARADPEEGAVGGEEGNNAELLAVAYAVAHLAEVFLLPRPRPSASDPASSSTAAAAAAGGDPLDAPRGSVSAALARYLRLHHSGPGSAASPMDVPGVAEMMEGDQPEYQRGPSPAIPGPYDRPYWNLLLRLVVQGRLEDAWAVLSRSSACRAAEDEAAEAAARGGNRCLSPEAEGFAALRAILLGAPLPGGRVDRFCADDHGLDDDDGDEDDDEDDEEEEEEDEEDAEDPGDVGEVVIDGLPPHTYLLWETLPRRAGRARALRLRRTLRRCGRAGDVADVPLEIPSLPRGYQPRAAISAHRAWQDAARDVVEGDVLDALARRFPPLEGIVSVLLGGGAGDVDAGLTWGEVLLAELLYARPDLAPDDVAARARAAMAKAGAGDPMEGVLLSVMEGNGGRVVETAFGLCGGASGAALPAVMTSLLCNLLVDAGRISPHNDSSGVNVQTELLLLAAESVLSSFGVQERPEIGVGTAVRLLLPHAPPRRAQGAAESGAGEESGIVYEPRISAMIAEVLSRRLPATDAEASYLLGLCEDAIRLGSVPIADACASLAFGRSSLCRLAGDVTGETRWLLRGMEVQASWLPPGRRRRLGHGCRRRFDALCESAADGLVRALSRAAISGLVGGSKAKQSEGSEVSSAHQLAMAVQEGLEQEANMALLLKGHLEANLLGHVVDVASARAKGDVVEAASNVIRCLDERRLAEEDHGGIVSTPSDPSMYSELLNIAFAILSEEEERCDGGLMENVKCAFSIHGLHILMARLTQVLTWEGIIVPSECFALKNKPSVEKKAYFAAMRGSICKGLMRALLVEGSVSPQKEKELTLEDEIVLMLSPHI